MSGTVKSGDLTVQNERLGEPEMLYYAIIPRSCGVNQSMSYRFVFGVCLLHKCQNRIDIWQHLQKLQRFPIGWLLLPHPIFRYKFKEIQLFVVILIL